MRCRRPARWDASPYRAKWGGGRAEKEPGVWINPAKATIILGTNTSFTFPDKVRDADYPNVNSIITRTVAPAIQIWHNMCHKSYKKAHIGFSTGEMVQISRCNTLGRYKVVWKDYHM